MKRPCTIIKHCDSLHSCAPRISIDANTSNVRIIIRYDDGTEEVIFQGDDFDEARHASQIKARKEAAWP